MRIYIHIKLKILKLITNKENLKIFLNLEKNRPLFFFGKKKSILHDLKTEEGKSNKFQRNTKKINVIIFFL